LLKLLKVNLPFHIAKRYLFSKKSHNAINIISGVSMMGVCIVTAAMIIVLSVFNGFEGLVVSLYNSFDPPIKVTPTEGKVMDLDSIPMDAILADRAVFEAVEVLEEGCLLRYKDNQYFARIKGVGSSFLTHSGLDSMMVAGEAYLTIDSFPRMILGQGVAYHISASMSDPINPVEVYVPNRTAGAALDPSKAFSVKSVFPSGVFGVQADYDLQYVLAPIEFVRELLDRPNYVTSLELALDPEADMVEVRERLQEMLGSGYVVKDRFQQHELLYKIMKSEKWAVFLILAFILMISVFNVIGSLTMLILEKKNDIAILRSMGADNELVRKIFILEGVFISMIGATSGLILGLLICWIQVTFGVVKLSSSGNYIVNDYPVIVQAPDVFYVAITVLIIGLLAAWLPVRKIIRPVETVRVV
jgi:lipoprotein-releasing system permease protein